MGSVRSADRAVRVCAAIACGMLIGLIVLYIRYPMQEVAYDFQAFWCGGNALLQHANPYLNQPLHACETHTRSALFARFPNLTVPAPLPPYALFLFVPLSLLPFLGASIVWWLALAAAMFAIVRGIALLAGISPARAAALSLLAVAGPAIVQGALAPIPIAFVIWGAIALRREQPGRAALLLGLAMIEPHMALPACAVVFLTTASMRWRLLLAGVCATALAFISVGPQVAWSYLSVMLPLHAASEVNNLGQDSLTVVLYHLGVPAAAALKLGGIQYVALAIAGGWAAMRLASADGDRSWLVILPAGFAVIGGAFVHLSEVAMAIPLACMIASRYPSRIASSVSALLAIPTESVINWATLALPASLVGAWLASQSAALRAKRYAGAAVIGIAASIVAAALLLHLSAAAVSHDQWATAVHIVDPGPNVSASVAWAQFNSFSRLPSVWWLEKLFTFVPLAALVGLVVRIAARAGSHARVAPPQHAVLSSELPSS